MIHIIIFVLRAILSLNRFSRRAPLFLFFHYFTNNLKKKCFVLHINFRNKWCICAQYLGLAPTSVGDIYLRMNGSWANCVE